MLMVVLLGFSFFFSSSEAALFSLRRLEFEELRKRARDNTPDDIRVAVPWYKPSRNETDLVPDYYIHETAEWLVFPHELDALSPDELRAARPEIARIVEAAGTPAKTA